MKLQLREDRTSELEVTIRYPKMDSYVEQLIDRVKSMDDSMEVLSAGAVRTIPVREIYYIEYVDRKTFIYTKADIFRTNKKLYQVYEKLKGKEFVQVSKSCIVNMCMFESIKTIKNSRLEVTLINGEKVNASRTYMMEIRTAFEKSRG